MEFWSLTAVLAEEERVKTSFVHGAVNMGYLDLSAGTANLEEGAKVELPIWCVCPLSPAPWVSAPHPCCFFGRLPGF